MHIASSFKDGVHFVICRNTTSTTIKYCLFIRRNVTEELMEKIAGEITLSSEPGLTIRKWREEFNLSQHQLAEAMNVSHSVISDYESGRRKSPGSGVIKKMVEALIELDREAGSPTIFFMTPEPGDLRLPDS